jgi:hypothetical protein
MRNNQRLFLLWISAALFAAAPLGAGAQVDVLTYRYDNMRSGANLKETVLKKSNVNKTKFGKLAFRNVDGNIYAQPLIVTQAKVAGRAAATNLAIVATEHNSVYAFDADDTSADPPGGESGKALWHTGSPGARVLGESVDSQEIYDQIGAPTCADLTTEVGITGTPVIKLTPGTSPREGVIFVAGKSKSGATQYTYTLFALNLADGKLLGSGAPIEGEVSVGARTISFDPKLQLNRPALLLDQNTLYIAFGGHCDAGDYRGWVFAYDVSNPSAPQKLDVFSSTFTERKNNKDKEGRGGIWMSGYGLSMDQDVGIYFATGDGTYNVTDPAHLELSNAAVKVKLASGKIQVQDWYAPRNAQKPAGSNPADATNGYDLKVFDTDLGSGGVVPVPGSHLVLAGGKEGRMYLIDRNDMGRGAKPSLKSFQVTNAPQARVANPQAAGAVLFWNIHGAPIIWPRQNDMFVYVMGEEDKLKQYRLIKDPGPGGWKFSSDLPFKKSKESVGLPPPNVLHDPMRNMIYMPGGFLTVSANGKDAASAIVWATMPFSDDANMHVVRGALRAFDASDVSKGQLWGSEDTGNPNDGLGFFAKYNPPVIANGKVYVAAFQQERIDNGEHKKLTTGLQPALVIYGLK